MSTKSHEILSNQSKVQVYQSLIDLYLLMYVYCDCHTYSERLHRKICQSTEQSKTKRKNFKYNQGRLHKPYLISIPKPFAIKLQLLKYFTRLVYASKLNVWWLFSNYPHTNFIWLLLYPQTVSLTAVVKTSKQIMFTHCRLQS